jgi:hypothetical protein
MWRALRFDPWAVVELFVFLALASAAGYLAVLVAWPIGPWLVARLVRRKGARGE